MVACGVRHSKLSGICVACQDHESNFNEFVEGKPTGIMRGRRAAHTGGRHRWHIRSSKSGGVRRLN